MNDDFSWVYFYTELADKIASYQNKQSALLNWLYSELSNYTHYLHLSTGKPLTQIDPFTLFGVFNRHISTDGKILVASKFQNFFDVKAKVPTDFTGIPPLSNENSMFFSSKSQSLSNDISNLWEIFCKVIKDPSSIGPLFDQMTEHQYGIKFNLTIALYWIRPSIFFPLDTPSRVFLNNLGIPASNDRPPSFNQYLKIIQALHSKIRNREIPENSFPEVTRAIYYQSHPQK